MFASKLYVRLLFALCLALLSSGCVSAVIMGGGAKKSASVGHQEVVSYSDVDVVMADMTVINE